MCAWAVLGSFQKCLITVFAKHVREGRSYFCTSSGVTYAMGKLIILNVFLNFMNSLFILTNKKNMYLFYCLILSLPPVPKGGIKTHFFNESW